MDTAFINLAVASYRQLLWLDVALLMAAAFLLAWAGRQLHDPGPRLIGLASRLLLAGLSAACVVQIHDRLLSHDFLTPADLARDLLAVLLSLAIIRQRKQQAGRY